MKPWITFEAIPRTAAARSLRSQPRSQLSKAIPSPILSAGPLGSAEAVSAAFSAHPPQVGRGTVLKLTGRPRVGGNHAIGPRGANSMRAEILFPPLPSGSIQSSGPPLERSNTTQAFIDGFALIYLALFVAGVLVIPAGLYLLFVGL